MRMMDEAQHVRHASRELVGAMRGECPLVQKNETADAAAPACGAEVGANSTPVHGYGWRDEGYSKQTGPTDPPGGLREVTCRPCLRIVRAAIDPVRWDAMEARGEPPCQVVA